MTEDKEKSSGEGRRVSTHEEGVNLPADPDAHRTDEEKAEIVCPRFTLPGQVLQ